MNTKTWPASRLIPVVALSLFYLAALYGATKILAGLNTGIAIATAALILIGMTAATPVVVQRARAAGQHPAEIDSNPPSLLSMIAVMTGSMAVFFVCTMNLAVGLALVFMAIFALMGAAILVLVFARIEVSTRDRLAFGQATA